MVIPTLIFAFGIAAASSTERSRSRDIA